MTSFLLPPELTIYEVGEMYADIMSLIEEEGAVALDGSQLLEIDCAGFQLISWLTHQSDGNKVINPSPQLVRYFSQFQIDLNQS